MASVAEVFPKLYHFARWQGAIGILNNNSLWATHCAFLNDKSEYNFAKDFLKERISSEAHKFVERVQSNNTQMANFISTNGGVKFQSEILTRDLIKGFYDVHGDDFYVTSFCGFSEGSFESQHGLLSQWRGYGGELGFCLVFDTKRLWNLMEQECSSFFHAFQTSLADVVYSNENSRIEVEFSNELSVLNKDVQGFLNSFITGIKATTSKEAHIAFQQIATRYKHRGFHQENEIRFVAAPIVRSDELKKANDRCIHLGSTQRPKPILYREAQGLSVPYIEFFGKSFDELPIERIIVGPGSRAADAKDLLERIIGDRKIEVTISDIPYI